MLEQAKRWEMYPSAPKDFLEDSPEHPVLLQILYNRGIRAPEQIASFLDGADAVQENPFRLKDMNRAVQRILAAIHKPETICVYGDFDADGITATALLVSALQRAGAQVGGYIPDRVDEGYGLNVEAIERISQQATLLVTVDCGIRSIEEVTAARQLGMDVIITDHHSVGDTLPPALAVINPRQSDDRTSFNTLAGVGVAYRLAQAVLRAVAQDPRFALSAEEADEFEIQLLDLVALGTIADMMPLVGENRSLVRRGLAQLSQGQRVGLFALMEVAGMQPASVDSTTVSFRLAPRINAAGRLSNAQLAYDLLRSDEYSHAYDLAAQLEAMNRERQQLTIDAQNLAEQQLGDMGINLPPILITASPDFRSGIVGLVAGRLADQYYRPAVVIERGPETSRGSARSIDEFDITDALDQLGHLLVRHGGHSRAAGFTVANERYDEFVAALSGLAAERLAAVPDLRPRMNIDAEVAWDELTWALQAELARLEPLGQANNAPLLLVRGCRMRSVRAVGGGKHLKLVLDGYPGSGVLDAIGFGLGERANGLAADDRLDIACYLEVNEWQGRRTLQLNVQDLRTATEE
ncbi:MAG: single-stranded-DNA-specific exonuclease RecJ [Caldilineaceae bacterium]|nr:single-stranded-DNA-specific exonuclease RecJ [Caldilineaceae bacterium]